MPLSELPTIERMTVARITAVPEFHPAHGSFEPFPVHAWVVRHPEASILVDTGVGLGHPVIDEWYRPEVVELEGALGRIGLAPSNIDLVVLSHLHFDHCGQLGALSAPVVVQRAEHRAAQEPHYTVEEWAHVSDDRLRLIDGGEELLDGIRSLPTPGHTPGHQSLVVEGGGRTVVIGGQCAFRADEVRSGDPAATNLHGDEWRDAAAASLDAIRSLRPVEVHLSHDPEIVRLS